MTEHGLARRLQAIEQRTRSRLRDLCEHPAAGLPPGSDWRAALMASLRAFSPDVNERQAYEREQRELAATPPCARCGWRPDAVFIEVAKSWSQHEPVA